MKKKLIIEGMSCSHCTARVKTFLEKLDGVENAELNLEEKTAVITLSNDVDDKILSDAVYDAGFDVVSIEAGE